MSQDLIQNYDDLLAPFHAACKPRTQFRIGIEAEHFGVHRKTFKPTQFEGSCSISEFFQKLVQEHGWIAVREVPDGPVISIREGERALTLEPGAQFEISGSPKHTVKEIDAEVKELYALINKVSGSCNISWLGLGFHPLARLDELPWVPKLRYPIMREYMPTRGKLAVEMMQRTCTVQTSLDFASEEDAMLKLRVALALQPVATALFANSPYVEGRLGSHLSERAHVWLHMDADRSGLLPFAWKDKVGFKDYVEWALDVPMFYVKRASKILRNTGQTFRAFWEKGFEGERANVDDWIQHLHTLFPEVRLKDTLEMRGADAQRPEMLSALPALWRGLLYDERALDHARALADRLRYDEVVEARAEIAKRALKARLGEVSTIKWAEQIYELAHAGLERLAQKGTESDVSFLKPLQELIERGQCPAEQLLARIDEKQALAPQLVSAFANAGCASQNTGR